MSYAETDRNCSLIAATIIQMVVNPGKRRGAAISCDRSSHFAGFWAAEADLPLPRSGYTMPNAVPMNDHRSFVSGQPCGVHHEVGMGQDAKSTGESPKPPRIVVMSANSFWNITNFRMSLVEALVEEGYRLVMRHRARMPNGPGSTARRPRDHGSIVRG